MRFRLSDDAYEIVAEALAQSPYDDTGASLDAIAINSLAGSPACAPLGIPAPGSKRLLIRLFPDQFECVRDALNIVPDCPSDADALVYICQQFIVAFGQSVATEST